MPKGDGELMGMSHTEKMQIGNIWITYMKNKKTPIHLEELRELIEIKHKRKKISYIDFYELRNFFNWKFQNVARFDKVTKCYELKKIEELDEEEAKTLV